ncbi:MULTISPECIES: GNAT family N-acetyltransferase [unclassified Mesorhizobium]|uniref:GNAT family N-acetyltransferase n=1 Tax=unclassified Mesorhizobium TaxID=325217 RepID=UPI000BAEAF66|nr:MULTISPECIES: GNAT family N-acetyltransferase [unclassified Mesorhizobium]TGT63979.1 N-acetyltransferase [Mesorhizobium sp. M00.F.Ca.ET.170.01.1.1]AZO11499.1 N-acetyltransferase [Mesorhizobium sp. M3A.F.Ca.ET.080.04.2.1]PBB88237.1 GNAT family N-acetyltransferase [Mesorhizobium sp. WSM3876]RWB67323.1 MAG: N-acetyltransferase [Mesorhizobium sp.]RWB92000.1 MAG: N-acetyltransferase [Mesorhizobium sp.]
MNSKQAGVPVLETARTILRAHALDDFETYVAMWADPGVTRFIGGKPRTREESWMRFLRHAGLWSLLGYGFWAIEDKKTGRFAGEAGFHDLKRDIEPSIEGVPEAGWALASEAQGQGLASEVVGRIVAWGDEVFGPASTVCIIDPENGASLKVAERNGYRETLRTTYHEKPTILLKRQAGGSE